MTDNTQENLQHSYNLLKQLLQDTEDDSHSEFNRLIAESEQSLEQGDLPESLPVLPLRNTVLFPGVVIPITVARDRSIQLVKEANRKPEGKRWLGVLAQKNSEVEDPKAEDLYQVGALAQILRLIRMPDGSVTIFIQGRTRFRVESFTQEEPYLTAQVALFPEVFPNEEEQKALMLSLNREAARIIELSPNIPTEAKVTLENINNLGFLIHFIASNLSQDVEVKQEVLEVETLEEKAHKVLNHLSHELQVLELTEEIQNKVKYDLEKQQRDFILRQQMKTIQDELGEVSMEDELEELREKAAKKKWPDEVQEVFDKELNRLYRLNTASPEYGMAMTYVETLLDLPWADYTRDRLDLNRARKILDRDHFGLEKVKDRILSYLAVLKLKKNLKAPILCLYGPPGVGKTSLGKSVAEALNRQFLRISLGGVRDEAEIRGHRRTYIGSMPGRIIQGLKKSKSGNPLMVLDEIDKVGNDHRGDPSSALLEVLDPEQNSTFSDHYLEVDYDLSTVLFIATANTLDTIHPALRDRMEIIEINGYTVEEKLEIAKRHLLPKAREEHGLKASSLKLESNLIQAIIQRYTRESGVRQLKQQLDAVCRGAAKRIVTENIKSVKVNRELLEEFLGPYKYDSEEYQHAQVPGVAMGLAWTAVGGEILYIETALMPGKGQLTLTGQLGEVMKESGNLAFRYLQAHAQTWGIPQQAFTRWDIHVHIPAGAIPKDGPSAGITLLTALASAYTQRPVKQGLAMTGEMTLRGKVLPVGGIREKVLAAKRAGLSEIVLCRQNEKDVREIPQQHLDGLNFHYVERLDEVLELALEPEPVEHPLNLRKTPQTLDQRNYFGNPPSGLA